jgi:hypothetical protein
MDPPDGPLERLHSPELGFFSLFAQAQSVNPPSFKQFLYKEAMS